MITHYDIATGEMLTPDDQQTDIGREHTACPALALRLVTTDEAVATMRRETPIAPALAAIPIDRLLARHR